MQLDIDIVSQIKYYYGQEATGALFLKLTNGQLVQIFFVRGEIMSVKYHGASGVEALKMVADLSIDKSRFYDGAVSRVAHQLPPTRDIIDQMNTNTLSKESVSAPASIVSVQQRKVIQALFVEHVGPIGDLIFSEELQEATSVGDLVNGLALQMDDDADTFRQQVSAALKTV